MRVEAKQLQEDLRPVADVELIAPNGKITSLTVPLAADGAAAGTLSGASSVRVEDAELWWTHDLGGQPRYQVMIRLRDGEQLLDERRDLVGLRTIALDRSEDPEGGRLLPISPQQSPDLRPGCGLAAGGHARRIGQRGALSGSCSPPRGMGK